jgi:hypothetical protein
LDGVVVSVNNPPTSGPNASNASAIEVVIQQPQKRFFSALMSSENLIVKTRAVAIPGANGTGCVVALNKSAAGAVTIKGTADVNLTACSLYDGSNSATALSVGGSGTLTAKDINVVGGISGTVTASGSVVQGASASAIADPYAGVSRGSFSGCDHTNMTAKNTVTLGRVDGFAETKRYGTCRLALA